MAVLCFDISSGGISAALFSPTLEPLKVSEKSWRLRPDETGTATLTIDNVTSAFKEATAGLGPTGQLDAICMGSFMHSSAILGSGGEPLTPVYTWLDRRGERGVEYIRNRLGAAFHERTGCHLHPIFPVFKLAELYLSDPGLLGRAGRVASVKAILMHKLTGVWADDYGMASSSGLYNVQEGDWDPMLLSLAGIKREVLPEVTGREQIIGRALPRAAAEFGIPAGTPVVNGSGDGFFATVGSDCRRPDRIAMSLGTSASARLTVSAAMLDSSAGTFCYRADDRSYLLGCASSNGGNVLDWCRSLFGSVGEPAANVPIFLPLLHGERSPDWNPRLTGSWHELRSQHTAGDLAQSVVEGVAFNLAHYVEILQEVSGSAAGAIVLSGNGFLERSATQVLAAVVDAQVRMPLAPGLATLRGAAICAFDALGVDVPPLYTELVPRTEVPQLRERFEQYKTLRQGAREV